jgi:hypothetical protein
MFGFRGRGLVIFLLSHVGLYLQVVDGVFEAPEDFGDSE